MLLGKVGTYEEEAVAVFYIRICSGRLVQAESSHKTRHGTGHTQPGVGLDIVRADQALEELVAKVHLFGETLGPDVQCYRVRTVFGNSLLDLARHQVERFVYRGLDILSVALHVGTQCSLFGVDDIHKGQTLEAKHALVHRIVLVAADCHDLSGSCADFYTAAGPAVTADALFPYIGLCRFIGVQSLVCQKQTRDRRAQKIRASPGA